MMNGDNAAMVCELLRINAEWLLNNKGQSGSSPSSSSTDDNGVPEFLLKKGEEMKTNVVDMASRRLPMPSGVVRFERLPVSMSAGPGAAEEVYGLDAVEYLDVAEAWARQPLGSRGRDPDSDPDSRNPQPANGGFFIAHQPPLGGFFSRP